MCNSETGKEVHHLQHQKDANEDGFIFAEDGSSFHKNHPANLMALCEKCHDKIHKPETGGGKKANKKVKTSVGVTLNIF